MSWQTPSQFTWYSQYQHETPSYDSGAPTYFNHWHSTPIYNNHGSPPASVYSHHTPAYDYHYQPAPQYGQVAPYEPSPGQSNQTFFATPGGEKRGAVYPDLEVPVLPDFTPERWDNISHLLVPDTADRVRTEYTRNAAPVPTTRRSLFHNGNLDRLSTAHNLMDNLLGVTGVCGVDDFVLEAIDREGSTTLHNTTTTRDQSRHEVTWTTVHTSVKPRHDQPEDRKRPASPAEQPPRKRARQNRASTAPLKTSTPLKRALHGAADLLPSPIPRKATRGSSSKVYPCEQCEKVYRHRSSLASHRASHHTGKLHTCPQCNKSFSHLSTLLKHQRIHTNQRPYVCTTCGAGFTQAGNLHRHVRNVHSV